jgi:hypothetical protein
VGIILTASQIIVSQNAYRLFSTVINLKSTTFSYELIITQVYLAVSWSRNSSRCLEV